MRRLDTDYIIISAGTTGLAFADTLIAETDANVTLVDRHGKPSGHWNDAYAFVKLRQPSSFYGVAAELASGPEVSGYFDRVMNHRLLASGRVSYFPLCGYLGEVHGGGEFVSGHLTPPLKPRRMTSKAMAQEAAVPIRQGNRDS